MARVQAGPSRSFGEVTWRACRTSSGGRSRPLFDAPAWPFPSTTRSPAGLTGWRGSRPALGGASGEPSLSAVSWPPHGCSRSSSVSLAPLPRPRTPPRWQEVPAPRPLTQPLPDRPSGPMTSPRSAAGRRRRTTPRPWRGEVWTGSPASPGRGSRHPPPSSTALAPMDSCPRAVVDPASQDRVRGMSRGSPTTRGRRRSVSRRRSCSPLSSAQRRTTLLSLLTDLVSRTGPSPSG